LKAGSALELSFIENVRMRRILPEGSQVVAAVSGGGDSVALLLLLECFRSHMGWDLEVLYVDHRTRPGTASEAEFVEGLAEGLHLPFTLRTVSEEGSGSLEDRFSRERQRIFDSFGEAGYLVATGHTADDRAETLLLRLLEGAGLRGLGGMDYQGLGPVRRPVLDLTRSQLRDYLRQRGREWMEDPTNRDDDIMRNRIRKEVLPVLESVHPGVSIALARSSANLSLWRDYADELISGSLDELVRGATFRRRQYASLPEALRLSILWDIAGRPRGGRLEIEKTDLWILSGKNGQHVLPGGKARICMDGEKGTVLHVEPSDERNRFVL